MVKGVSKSKVSQFNASNRHMSIDSTKHGSLVLEGNGTKVERDLENIPTSRRSKAYEFSMATMDNDYGSAEFGKYELSSDLNNYQKNMKTYDLRSKERLK